MSGLVAPRAISRRVYLDYIHHHTRSEMPRDIEEQRRRGREAYARAYPPGFKRRRNAEQTKLQRAAQRRYQNQAKVVNARRLQRQVREYLAGTSKAAATMIGCSQEQLKAHLESTLAGAKVIEWKLGYHRHPREFDDDRGACHHYTNLYAIPIPQSGSFQCPLQQARSPTDSSHAVLSYQA